MGFYDIPGVTVFCLSGWACIVYLGIMDTVVSNCYGNFVDVI